MFRMRAKADTYNDETRVKHTAVSIDNIDYAAVNKWVAFFCVLAFNECELDIRLSF